jgi:hypothetical protein
MIASYVLGTPQHVPFHTLSLLEHRKDPFGATFGTGQTSLWECPFSRVHVDFSFLLLLLFLLILILCPPHRLALDNKTSLKLRHTTRYVFHSHSFPLSSPAADAEGPGPGWPVSQKYRLCQKYLVDLWSRVPYNPISLSEEGNTNSSFSLRH